MSQDVLRVIIKYFVIFGFFIVIPLVIFMSKKPKQKKITWKNNPNGPSNFNKSSQTAGNKNSISVNLKNEPQEYINCHFTYNGKTYDAYEVLGVPAGADAQAISKAYRAQSISFKNKELLSKAYESLKP